MTVAGIVYPLSTWAHRTKETDGGYWPTAVANDSKSTRNATVKNRKVAGHSGTTLTDFVTLFPTPAATNYGSNKGGSAGRVGKERYSLDSMARLGKLTPTGGQLNPTWVEWLMGYPSEWTVLNVSVTQSFPLKLAKPSAG